MKKFFDIVVDTNTGRPIAGATVQVRSQAALGVAASSLATIYADSNGTPTAVAGQVTTGPGGYYEFFVANGYYTIDFINGGSTLKTVTDVEISADVTAAQIAATGGAALVGESTGTTVELSRLARIASRTALAAYDTGHGFAYLTEAGREGIFKWTTGNMASRVAADTQQGIYVASGATASSAGAWVRQLPRIGTWHADWFGLPDDPAAGLGGGTQVTADAQFSAMLNLGVIDKPARIEFGSKIYTLTAHVPLITWQCEMMGARGAQMTVIVKRYVEADTYRGVLAFTDFAAVVRNLSVASVSGSGGSLISAILTLNAPQQGLAVIEDCILSSHDFCNYGLYVNGTTNTQVGGPGYRGVWIRGGEIFGATLAAIKLVGVQHFMTAGMFAATSGGSSATVLDISGSSTVLADDNQIHGILAGNVILDYVTRSAFHSPQMGNITVSANCTDVTWHGPVSSGVVTNNAPVGAFIYAGVWAPYTPVLTAGSGTFTAASVTGRYAMNGKTVFFQLVVTVTTAGTASGSIEVTLPIAASQSAAAIGVEDSTGLAVRGHISLGVSTTKVFIREFDNTTVIANGRTVTLSGAYETA